MLRTALAVAAAAAVTVTAGSVALGHDNDGPRPLKPDAKWTTVFKPVAPLGIEGLTAAKRGTLCLAGRGATPCPVYKISGTTSTVVGNLPAPCGPAGLAFGPDGRLY